MKKYRGRIAPTPTGFLHLGHARTFLIASKRAQENNGVLIYRNEDLDPDRCKNKFVEAAATDLRKCGIEWHEGPECGGPHAPYSQSQRLEWFQTVWQKLKASGHIYPCNKSRKDVQNALQAPHSEACESIFPKELRPKENKTAEYDSPGNINWRFRVPDNEVIEFTDLNLGRKSYTTMIDLGDFLVWRRDGFPSYEMAVVADDHAMDITEVVRGEDLLVSTARQILLYRALNWPIPDFFHCRLVCDKSGKRLAKRNNSLSLRSLFETGRWNQVKNILISESFLSLNLE